MTSRGDKARTVPKFSSFKPKPPSIPDSVAARVEATQPAAPVIGDEFRHPPRHAPRHRDSERSHRRPHREKPVERARSQELQARDVQRYSSNPSDAFFVIDKRGDPLVRRYGGNDRSNVPSYYRFGRGRLLGSSGFLEIHRHGNREEFSIRGYREGGSAFRDRNILAQAARLKARRFKKTFAERSLPAKAADFIPLPMSRKRKRGDEEPDSSPDRDMPNYRSIEGNAKPHEDSDSDFGSDSDRQVQSLEDRYLTPAKKRSIQLSQAIKEHPGDTDAWLELIALQDDLFRENEDDDHIRTKEECKGLAELKLSMFEKALAHVASDRDREKVLVGLMREGSRAWKSQTLAKRWLEVTEQNPESFTLWKHRIDFELTNMATYSYEEIKQRFIDRLRSLEQTVAKADATRQCELAEEAIYVFLRLTKFLYDTGFVDLAVGAWQGLLELHFARPGSIGDDRHSAISSLGEFWESESPRIGEPGAMGWHKFLEVDNGMTDLPEGRQPGRRRLPETTDVYKAWVITERQRCMEARMPARTVDEGADDDPYRVIMFSDIEPLLVFFPSGLLEHVRIHLVDAYLLFSQLLPVCGSGKIMKLALDDPFVYSGSRDFEGSVTEDSKASGTGLEQHRQPPRFKQDGSRIAISPEVLFSGPTWFRYLASWRELYPKHDEPIEGSYVLTTIQQLFLVFRMEGLGEYHLALQWLDNPAGAKKVARAILKQYPSNVRFYNAYALLEWAGGNAETSRKVLSSVTSQRLGEGPASQMLWNTWAWIELDASENGKALSRLCYSVDQELDNSTVSPASLLKVRSRLSTNRDYSISSGRLDEALELVISLTLIDYLSSKGVRKGGEEPLSTAQGNIAAAMAVIHGFSDDLCSRGLEHSAVHERSLQFAARLLYFHASHGPFRPIFFREQLQRFVILFPKNTIFLTLFAWVESSLRIDDPVRDLLQKTSLTEAQDCVSSRLFAIRHELHIGNIHSTRTAFEKAVESEACRGTPQLWLYYIRFCYNRKELRSRTRDIFYRAIANYPGSKALYLEAFGGLIKDMSSSELKAVFSTISSKGLRIHVDLDDFIQKWRA